ncbi:VanZ family protein [Streptomyces sp. NPDC097619]|uniref:VanZ family protein n=1 Tax=Streptomyces sp. NPDC097619 TaxID=3157228 RepID=UPI00332F87BF
MDWRKKPAPPAPDGGEPVKDPAAPVTDPPATPAARRGRSRPAARPAYADRPPAHPVVRALAMFAALVGLVLFSLVLARLTLEPSAASVDIAHSNVRPGASISLYLEGATVEEAAKQLGGNLLLGVPFGILLPVLVPQTRGLLRVTVPTAAVMVLVELIQGALVAGRAFDVDDVILNTAGALLGYLFFGRRLSRAVHRRRAHWWHRWTRRGHRDPVVEPTPEPAPAPIAAGPAQPAMATATTTAPTATAEKPGPAGARTGGPARLLASLRRRTAPRRTT